jgi:hypothetical protein
MTRSPATIHAVPIGSRGDHRPYASCPCRPIEAVDLADGPLGRLILMHHDAPAPRFVADWHPLARRDPDAPDDAA